MSERFAMITGASSGLGLELAVICAQEGFDLLVAADHPEILRTADRLRGLGAEVRGVEADLATTEGVDRLWAATDGRPLDALLVNAGHGVAHGFLDQDFATVRHVIETTVTGTLYLVQLAGRQMRARRCGHIVLIGAVAAFLPGTYQAMYDSTGAFLDSLSFILRSKLTYSGVTVTSLMPGPTEMDYFTRAHLLGVDARGGECAAAALRDERALSGPA